MPIDTPPFTAEEIAAIAEEAERFPAFMPERRRFIATIRERDARLGIAVAALEMIRDGHTVAFPDEIAAKALEAMNG